MSLASISLTFHEEAQINGIHTVIFLYELECGIWNGCMHGQYADGSLVVHPVTSKNIPGRTLIVVLAPELQQDQMENVLIEQDRCWIPAAIPSRVL